MYSTLTIAYYEFRSLVRTNAYRVLPGIYIFAMLIASVRIRGLFFLYGWVPLMASVYLSYVQPFAVAVIASEVFGRSVSRQSTDVLMTRPFTNAQDIAGRFLAVMGGAALLALPCYLVMFALQVVKYNPSAYGIYPYPAIILLLPVPAALAVAGLSAFLVTLLEHYLLSLMLLFVLIFAANDRLMQIMYQLGDYRGISLPMVQSVFTGFGNLPELLPQRIMYVCAGIALAVLSVSVVRRFPNRRHQPYTAVITAIILAGCAGLSGRHYLAAIHAEEGARTAMRELNARIELPRPSIDACALAIDHRGERMTITAELMVRNGHAAPLDTLLFSLNPGLTVTSVRDAEDALVAFDRNRHLLFVRPEFPLAPEDSLALAISYEGSIHENACWLGIDEAERALPFLLTGARIDKRHAFLTPQYVLLTRESMWYPMPGVFEPTDPFRAFTRYSLKVKHAPSLTAISQGERTTLEDGVTEFRPEYPLTQISLIIGPYVERRIGVDGIEYALYTHENNDILARKYGEITADDVEYVIRESRDKLAFDLRMDYPFKRLYFVETPIQCMSYDSVTSVAKASQQPEQIHIEEFAALNKIPERRIVISNARLWGNTLSVRDVGKMRLKYLIDETVMIIGSHEHSERKTLACYGSDPLGFPQMYHRAYDVFPNYYGFVNCFSGGNDPYVDLVFKCFLSSKMKRMNYIGYNFTSLEDKETLASRVLANQSLHDVLTGDMYVADKLGVLECKTEFLFSCMNARSSGLADTFDRFYSDFLVKHRFRGVSPEVFENAVR